MGVEEDLTKLDNLINKLKYEYEQYFMGELKIEPSKLRGEVEALIRSLHSQPITRAAPKFRFNTLMAKYNTYRSYWERILREILEGTSARDKLKLSLGAGPSSPAKQGRAESTVGEQEQNIREAYNEYIRAKKKRGEDTTHLSFEKVSEIMKSQASKLKEKLKCKSVEFKVDIEEGKVKLKALPRDS